jgi:hypothetical protein
MEFGSRLVDLFSSQPNELTIPTNFLSKLPEDAIRNRRAQLMAHFTSRNTDASTEQSPAVSNDNLDEVCTTSSTPTDTPVLAPPQAFSAVEQRKTQFEVQTSIQQLQQKFQARRMMKRAREEFQHVEVGSVVNVLIPNNDRGALDHPQLRCVVVQRTPHNLFRLATNMGVLQDCLNPSDISCVLPENASYYGLDEVMNRFRNNKLPKISLRQASMSVSVTKSLNVACQCQGTCDSQRCSCKRSGRNCGSGCHPSSKCCENKQ